MPDADFKIHKNIPIPERHRKNRYPFAEMQVGDVFFVPPGKEAKLSNAAWWHGKKYNKKFSIQRYDKVSYGCWRLK